MGVLEREKSCQYCGTKSLGKFECPNCGAPLR
jgi:transposase